MRLRLLINILTLCWGFLVSTNASAITTSEAIELAQKQQLSVSSGWLALGHYRYSSIHGVWQSQADAPDFFLSSTGKTDPSAELLATIRLYYGDEQSTEIDHITACHFPARRLWLSKYLGDGKVLDCPTQEEWLADLLTTNMSIVFASSYLNSPSSMFGHTYLRFYNEKTDLLLMSPSVTYAADSEKRKGIIDFAFRGLTGGFPGVADKLPHYRRVRNYTENEGRSLWEYPINMSPDQIKLIALHLWEIKDAKFDYYFLNENCSYLLLTSLSVADPEKINTLDFETFAIPVDIIRKLNSLGKIKEPQYWPSADARLASQIARLSASEQKLVVRLAKSTDEHLKKELSNISDEKRLRVLHAALNYISIIISRNLTDEDVEIRLNTIKNMLLQEEKFSLPPTTEPPPRPHERT